MSKDKKTLVPLRVLLSHEASFDASVDGKEINTRGVKIKSPKMLAVGRDVSIQMKLPNCPYVLKVPAEVKWSVLRNDPKPFYECGLEFIIVDLKDDDYIRAFVGPDKEKDVSPEVSPPHERKKNELLVPISIVLSGEASIDLSVSRKDMNMGGLTIKSPKMLTVGRNVSLQMRLPNCDYTIKIASEVKWSVLRSKDPKPFYECGLEYIILNAKDKEYLRIFLGPRGAKFAYPEVRPPYPQKKDEEMSVFLQPEEAVSYRAVKFALVLMVVIVMAMTFVYILNRYINKSGLWG